MANASACTRCEGLATSTACSASQKLAIAFVFHNHQPVGNLPDVFCEAFQMAYEPLLSLLEDSPSLKASLHYTGPLLEWLASEEPGFLCRVQQLCGLGRVEVLGGALYEPILAAIPDADKLGQLRAMSAKLEELLGERPYGAWLAERVWEPHLATFFVSAGLRYTIVDCDHVARAGCRGAPVGGYYLTDNVGESFGLFPASTELRYLIPWREVEEVLHFLRCQYERGQRFVLFADDGEKFGLWPGTYELCYERGYLRELFHALAENEGWLQAVTLKEWWLANPPLGRVYIPSAAYPEMEDWSLDPEIGQLVASGRQLLQEAGHEQLQRFFRVGHWRNFLVRYPEAGWLRQRTVLASRRLHAVGSVSRAREEALAHLWRSQCNCPYWHGLFGGIFLPHLRHAAYRELLTAEWSLSQLRQGRVFLSMQDMDGDGCAEAEARAAAQALFVRSRGGYVAEWSCLPRGLNLLGTLGKPKGATYLQGPPGAFVDHCWPSPPRSEAELESLLAQRNPWQELVYSLSARVVGAQPVILAAGATCGAQLEKTFALQGPECLEATISCCPGCLAASMYAVELNLSPPPGFHEAGQIRLLGASVDPLSFAALDDVSHIHLAMLPASFGLAIQCEPKAMALIQPLISEERTQAGTERVYQGTRVLLGWHLPSNQGRLQVRVRLALLGSD